MGNTKKDDCGCGKPVKITDNKKVVPKTNQEKLRKQIYTK